jgi:CheY-like chemotaxis protein
MRTILVVDDNKVVRMLNERILAKAGYHVLGAGDGEEALQIALACHPNLILLDMLLPKLSGQDVLYSLKRDPSTAQIPVLVLTGLSQKNRMKLCREGAAGFLEKGTLRQNPQALLAAVRGILDGHNENREPSGQRAPSSCDGDCATKLDSCTSPDR